jgi:non-ribosomal peptide synthetase component E (peptide arylation enzyme)
MSTTTLPTDSSASRYSAAQIQEFRDRGQWDQTSLHTYLDALATADPDRPALTDGYGALTRGELRAQARRLARSLLRLGIRPGDRVQVQLPNWNEFVVVYVALARIGAVLVPTMPVYRHDEVRYVLRHSGARMSIVAESFHGFGYAEMIRELAPDTAVENVVVVRGTPAGGLLALDELTTGDAPTEEELGPLPSAEDTHAIIYTSGTESRPKGCQHTFATMSFTAHRLARDVFRLTEDDVMFMPTPVTHATGLAAGVMMPLLYGAGIHLVDAWEPHDGMRRIARFRTTVSIAATPFLQMSLGAVTADPTHDLSSMRVWASAGAPIPRAMLEEWRTLIPTCQALPVYGNSEALVVAAMQLGDPEEKVVSSDGRPAHGVRLEVRDEDGRAVDAGVEGEIAFASPGLLLGYWNDPEKTAATIGSDGFFASGDLGRLDEDGFLRVTGRIKDLIIRGGINISAREVEENAVTHPAIEAIAAVSMPDERMGEKVCAFVVPAGDARITVAELAAYLQQERRIAIQKCPERIVFVEALPMTATGKIKKFELRRRAAESPVPEV